MKAFVCDKCGKVCLIDDDKAYYTKEHGIYHLMSSHDGVTIDLCEDCVQELMAVVRQTKEEPT